MENDQSHRHERYKNIIENIVDVVWELDNNLVFTFVSQNVKELCGYEAGELTGRNVLDFITDETKRHLKEQVKINIDKKLNGEQKAFVLHETQLICKGGKIKWVEISANLVFAKGELKGYIGTVRDISNKKEYECQVSSYIEELKKNNVELKKIASIDALTGAYSRRKFEDDINSLINNKCDVAFSLILIDIDNFKIVNDLFGHKKGDAVLKNISYLISNNIRKTDMFFRWGGEEFIIILPKTDLKNAGCIADKIRKIIKDHDFGINKTITVSLGVGEKIQDENADEIIKRIDMLLYAVKKQGGNRVLY
jgi:diguanylate cyclase (GGDEF)-like protein/PAS domain S-box-containing protein